MLKKIRENIDQPEVLESLYSSDKKAFEKAFKTLYSEIENTALARFWKARIDFANVESRSTLFQRRDLLILIVVCIIAGLLIKLPSFLSFESSDYLYYQKNGGIILFFGLSLFIIWTNNFFAREKLILTIAAFALSAIYINLLPYSMESQSVNLALIHMPLFMWCVYGLVYMNFDLRDPDKRMNFIKHNGDLAILGSLLLIAGIILTGITIGLFSAIEINIENFYMEYFGTWGLISAPVVAVFIMRNYPVITNKIAPIIANIFSPLVAITLIAYLITIPVSGKDPYNDREFLLVFNMMLLGVMGIIVFSISETSIRRKQRFTKIVLLILTFVTFVIDLIALSAICYRLIQFGITPNRIAVAGSNLLIFGNLVWIMIDFFRINFKNSDISIVELTVSRYLPIYALWTVIVTFGFPLIFDMK